MSIVDAARKVADQMRALYRREDHPEHWYVQVPLYMKHQMIAEHGSVEAALETFRDEHRHRLTAISAVGIEFESVLTYGGKPVRDVHRWPWLDEQDVERAWWQAIA